MKQLCCCINFQGIDKICLVSSKIRNQNARGFTLIELLVALALSSIMMVGIIEVFRSNTTSYFTQDDIAAMQQNVRVAKMFLERDIRMAGAGYNQYLFLEDDIPPIQFENGAGPSDTDKLTITYVDYSSDCTDLLPQLTLTDEMPVNSSEATVKEDLKVVPYSMWEEFSCNGTDYGGSPFQEFRAIIRAPDGTFDIISITQVQPNSNKLQNRPYNGELKLLNTYPEGSTIDFFNENSLITITYSYFYDTQTKTGNLWREDLRYPTDPKALAQNIEDLQFSFGLDTDGDDVVNTWVNNRDLDNTTTPLESAQVRLVDVNIVGRSQNPHDGQSSTRPAIEDRSAANTSDKYVRKIIQVTVKTRNIR